MPIYEYSCSKCGHIFEEWAQRFDSPDHEPCPECGGDASRIVSNTSFVLKGQGWYVTEYGNKNKTNHESGAAAPEEGKAEGAKPAEGTSDGSKAESGSAAASQGKGESAAPAQPAKAESTTKEAASGAASSSSSAPAKSAKGDSKAA